MPRFLRPIALRVPNKEKDRHATWLELFFDLIFAVIITELGNRLFHNLSFVGVLQCSALFLPVFWTWMSYTVYSARFDNNDTFQLIMTFVIMFAGVIMAIQTPNALEEGALGFSIGFLMGQLALFLLYSRIKYTNPTQKNVILFFLVGISSGGIFWLISLFFDPPFKFILWSIGMCVYLIAPWIAKNKILSKAPLHPVYLPERFGAFTIIILGQTTASVVFGLKFAHWNLTALITSVLAFILAIIIWVQYSQFTQIADFVKALRAVPFIAAHIPLIISLIIMGVCTENYIIAPNLENESIDLIFCTAVVVYLISFYILQHISMRKHKFQGMLLVFALAAILSAFLFHFLSPLLTLLGLDIIFMFLFSIEYIVHKREINQNKRT